MYVCMYTVYRPCGHENVDADAVRRCLLGWLQGQGGVC